MRLSSIIGIIILLLSIDLSAQNNFEKTLDVLTLPAFISRGNIILTNDGGYAIAFNRSTLTQTDAGAAIIKCTSGGDPEWANIYEHPLFSGQFVCQEPTGNFLIARSYADSIGGSQMALTKTNSNGILLWQKNYGNSNPNMGQETGKISLADSNYYFIAGQRWHHPTPSATWEGNYLLAKTDSLGNLIWMKEYDSGLHDELTYAIKTKDTAIVMIGFSKDTITQFYYIYAVKVDLNGNMLWSKKYYTGTLRTEPLFVSEGKNHEMLITGKTWDFGAGDLDIFLSKFTSSGNFSWGKTWGGFAPDEGYSVHEISDGGYILCAEPESFAGVSQATLIKTDSNGNTKWMKGYGNPTGLFPFGAVVNKDNGFTIFGMDGSFFEMKSVYLLRTDSTGKSPCANQNVTLQQTSFSLSGVNCGQANTVTGISSCPILQDTIQISVTNLCDIHSNLNYQYSEKGFDISPNPFSISTTIYSSTPLSNATLIVYNSLGMTVREITGIYGSQAHLGSENMPDGIYFIRINQGATTLLTKQIVIQRN